jgi:hypothetical protein
VTRLPVSRGKNDSWARAARGFEAAPALSCYPCLKGRSCRSAQITAPGWYITTTLAEMPVLNPSTSQNNTSGKPACLWFGTFLSCMFLR